MRVDDGEVLNTLVAQHPEITLAADSATPVWYDIERDTSLILYDTAAKDMVKALIVRLNAGEAVWPTDRRRRASVAASCRRASL